MRIWGRKDAFPGADGSTIIEPNGNATTVTIYGASGAELLEDETGYCKVDITMPGVVIGNHTLTYAIKHPITFICNTTTPYDWYSNNELYQNNNLWGNSQSSKSAYDPCPAGWHVPIDGTWNDFTVENTPYYIKGLKNDLGSFNMTNGRLYNNQVWFPAAGYRRASMGTFYYIGGVSGIWSSSFQDTQALHIHILMNNLLTNNPNYCAVSHSVRCIQG